MTHPRPNVVPYITAWSAERTVLPELVMHPRRAIGYADETIHDRDEHGVLWARMTLAYGKGKPMWRRVHFQRQRRAMRKLLCQVCGRPADRNEQGVLWLLGDDRRAWPNWPEGMAATHPPVCLPCAQIATQLCPYLQQGFVAVRVGDSEVAAVYGERYAPRPPFPRVEEDAITHLDDPRIRWVIAAQLVRELFDCTIVDLDEEVRRT
ncbi:hypothetical protein ABT301_00810 [Streptomyces sp. NPDC000987]|uniref:hypothetical protein n=1 Tax=Streptomyces sp. NPDC000987 TaxID=3154374 RepID=UPI0033321D43